MSHSGDVPNWKSLTHCGKNFKDLSLRIKSNQIIVLASINYSGCLHTHAHIKQSCGNLCPSNYAPCPAVHVLCYLRKWTLSTDIMESQTRMLRWIIIHFFCETLNQTFQLFRNHRKQTVSYTKPTPGWPFLIWPDISLNHFNLFVDIGSLVGSTKPEVSRKDKRKLNRKSN